MSALHPGRLIAACVLTCVIAGGIIARTRGAARPPDLRAVLTTCMDSDMDSVLVQPHSRASKQGAVTGNPRGSLARMLCCLAQQPNVNIVLDAFMGRGMTAATLGGCMERVGKQYWRISGFEMDPSTAMRARSILAHSGLAVKVLRCGSTLPEQPQHCNLQDIVRPRSATVIQGRLDAHNVQRLCARSAPDVVILDPISSVPNEIWAIHAECRPQFVILNNINLPDHAGWFKEHLLQAGLWREVISGYLEDANPGGNAQKLHGNASLWAIYERRRWTLLVRGQSRA